MDLPKHKKALRGLITKTENDDTSQENQSSPTGAKTQTSTHLHTLGSPLSNKGAPIAGAEHKNQPEYSAENSALKIQYNFDLLRAERSHWQKKEYIAFLQKIDSAQTEAFFLKGKLISEIKDKFYDNNKTGWKEFCDDNLNMNYTTANQYIRVAKEFNANALPRKDFGFEHFKALLPVPTPERNKLLDNLPTSNVSVKSLRDLVTKTLSHSEEKNTHPSSIRISTNAITENLQKVKTQLDCLNLDALNQTERWKLLGAFRSLSEEMSHFADLISKTSDSSDNPSATHPHTITEERHGASTLQTDSLILKRRGDAKNF